MLLTALLIACKLLSYSAKPRAKLCETWQANTYKCAPSLTYDVIILYMVEFVTVCCAAFQAFHSF